MTDATDWIDTETDDDDPPPPPAGLADAGAAWWREVVAEFDMSSAEYRLFAEACHALDRAEQARNILEAEGMCVLDRAGNPKAHPMLDVEARCRQYIANAVRVLGAKLISPSPTGRPANVARRRAR